MVFDFTIAQSVNTLQEYYDRLCKLHAKAHGSEYLLVHDEIKEKLKKCNSYTEFGVNQGATLAAALLQNPKKIRAYDTSLSPYNFAKHHFEKYANDNNIDFVIYETNTLTCKIDPVDLLYIDTKHEYKHLTEELKLHGHKVKKFIIFHDTFTQRGLERAIDSYINQHPEWFIINQCRINVGFTTTSKFENKNEK